MTDALRHAEQQMLVARPWEAAEERSIWEITGQYPARCGEFHECLAQVLPKFVTGVDEPLFLLLGPLATVRDPIPPTWISRARPLLLVHRDDPSTPYYDTDRVWLAHR